MNKMTVFSKRFWLSDLAIIGYIALFNLILHLVAIEGFGYFRDEFYFMAGSDHLDFGYVDSPPLSILLLKLVRLIFGDSATAIRLLPVLGGALFVFLTGLLARELGGKRFAMILAAIAAFAPIGNFFLFSYYSMNFLDMLFWLACFLIVVRIIKTDNPRYWLVFGLTAGLGLQNKISVLFLCFGLFVGIILTDNKKYLKSKYLWLGAALAGLLFLPYILWNMSHGWATLEFMHNARTYKMAAVSSLKFLTGQILYNNPATLIVWLAGLGYFFFHPQGKKYRLFGWMFLAIYILMTLQQAKNYYLAAAYPILFAGGAVLWEAWLLQRRRRWPKPVLVTAILVPALILCPLALPILPVDATIDLVQFIGVASDIGERHRLGPLPQHFADMHGWEKMVATVADVYSSLSPQEQSRCLIYVRNYGQAGAIDLLGKKYGLPKATCGHNNYWWWGPGDWDGEVAIVFGIHRGVQISLESLRPHFESVQHVAMTQCRYCMPYENNWPIFVCRGLKHSWQENWATKRFYI